MTHDAAICRDPHRQATGKLSTQETSQSPAHTHFYWGTTEKDHNANARIRRHENNTDPLPLCRGTGILPVIPNCTSVFASM